VQRLFEHVDAKPGQYSEKDISEYFWHDGAYPQTEEYRALFHSGFVDYRLRVHGLVENPVEAHPGRGAVTPPTRADHSALLHPGLVRSGQVGRRVDVDDLGSRATPARGRLGGVLLARRRVGSLAPILHVGAGTGSMATI
jgi:hypothetical protein